MDIWRSAGRFDASQGSDKVFIAMIARRRLIDRLRKTTQRAADGSRRGCSNRGLVGSRHRVRNIARSRAGGAGAAGLRPEQRQVLELGLLQGLSQSEIAARLGMPLGTVKSFMRRGLIKVREYMNVDAYGVAARI